MIKCIYPNMVAMMADKSLSIRDIATTIGKNQDTVRKKLAGVNPFTINEALSIQEKIFPEIEFKVLYSQKAHITGADSAS